MAATWAKWGVTGLALACAGAAAVVRAAAARQSRAAGENERQLLATACAHQAMRVRSSDLVHLPPPVARYFRRVLGANQAMIRVARFHQCGTLRTSIDSNRWMPFEAAQVAAPPARGFVWNARVALTGPLHLRVLDGYRNGRGSGRVLLQSALAIGAQSGSMEMNTGALQRYLAEGPWYPTALLPAAGVRWSAIDDRRAQATISDAGITVSLEFRFNDDDEIVAVHTPGRWRSVGKRFVRTPWEGHFGAYQQIAGMQVPTSGEVGWIGKDGWQPVWKGRILDIAYEFFPEPASLQC